MNSLDIDEVRNKVGEYNTSYLMDLYLHYIDKLFKMHMSKESDLEIKRIEKE